MTPSPSSRQAGRISRSMFLSTSEYCGCRQANLSKSPNSLIYRAFISCQPVKLETPT
jgi:hypothetical protein